MKSIFAIWFLGKFPIAVRVYAQLDECVWIRSVNLCQHKFIQNNHDLTKYYVHSYAHFARISHRPQIPADIAPFFIINFSFVRCAFFPSLFLFFSSSIFVLPTSLPHHFCYMVGWECVWARVSLVSVCCSVFIFVAIFFRHVLAPWWLNVDILSTYVN